jgi:ABC-type glycerol-3-phosphate transport system substrate-binding protein
MKLLKRARFICLAASLMLAGSRGVAHADTTLTVWSFWGDLGAKRDFIDKTVKLFEAAHPGTGTTRTASMPR